MRSILQEALVACFLFTIPVTMADECYHPDGAFVGPNYEYPCDENVESEYNTKPPTMAPSDLPSVVPSGFPSSPPSNPPTMAPSDLPSVVPSGFPSSPPSNPPTMAPSDLPSVVPSGFPSSPPSNSPSGSRSPSGSPSLLPSATSMPSVSPSLMPSNSPSLSGSPTSSQSPTSSSVPTLTEHPTSLPEQCVSSFGVFGDILWTSTVVDFGYELEINVARNGIEELILPDLEVAMVDSVLSGLFPADCDQTGTRKLQLQRRLQVEGISGNPTDIILDDLSCQSQLDSENTCVVVSGQMTLYANGNSNTEAVLLQDILIQNMEDGTYVNGPIARVSYAQLDPSPDGQQNESDNDVNQVRDSGGSGDGSTVGLGLGLAIAGAAIVVTAGVLYTRRKKSQTDHDATVPPILNSYLNLDP